MTDIKTLALQCRDAATAIASLPTEAKNALLRAMADALLADEAVILAANARDIEAAAAKGIGSAMLDRLRLDTARLQGIAAAVREVAVERPTGMAQTADFEVADRIISIRLVPPVGVLNMRVYQESKVIKRDLIIHEPRLRAIMRGRRFTFPDAPFDPKADLEGIKDETVQLAEKLINAVSEPYLVDGHELEVGASIGISFYPDDGQNSDELIRNADAALYQAKAEGRNTYRFYTKALTERAHNRLTLESQLRQAIKRGEFILYYQPLVDTLTGKPLGVEALVRWNSPQGMISPADFIPLAEDTGLIVPIGTWVLREACRQAQALRSQGFALETLAVNLSPRQFRQADLLKQVRDALHDSGLPAACLELEITEGALMDDVAQTQATLGALKSLGLRLAVDDFGTGYSSLAYLRRFPLDKLKIDQSFMRGVPTDQGNLEIVATIIALARTLNLTVIAEGVETHEQHQALCQLACEQCQGYLFSRPLSIEQLHDWLAGDRQAVG